MENSEITWTGSPDDMTTPIKKKRHKWDKHKYSGKYSSFEIDADCTVCGCNRKKLFEGYEYTMNGEKSYYAPPCKPNPPLLTQ